MEYKTKTCNRIYILHFKGILSPSSQPMFGGGLFLFHPLPNPKSPHPCCDSPVGLTQGWSSRWCTCGWFHLACEGVTRTPQHCWQRRAQLWCQLGVQGLNHKGETRRKPRAEQMESIIFLFMHNALLMLRFFHKFLGRSAHFLSLLHVK